MIFRDIIKTKKEGGLFMANEIVKHHNDLNTVPMRNWTREEMDFFFSILSKLRNKGTEIVEFDKYELKELANSSIRHNKRFEDTIESLVSNVAKIHYIERTSNRIALMNLFSRFEATWLDDLSDMTLSVKVTDEFEYVVNKLNAEFTTYELEEFTQIRSTYAKTVYRLLKQWRTVGKKEFKIDEFKLLLDTPKYYGPSEIDKNVLAPVMRDLPPFFEGLKIKKVKENRRGNPVKSYIFSWKPEQTGEYDPHKFEKKSYGKPLKFESKPDWMTDDKKELSDKKISEDTKNLKDELQRQYPKFFDKN